MLHSNSMSGPRDVFRTDCQLMIFFVSLLAIVIQSECTAVDPTSLKDSSHLEVAIDSDAISGMGKPNSPVRLAVKITNPGNTTVTAKVEWSVNSVAITPAPEVDRMIQISPGKTQEFTKSLMLPAAGFVELTCRIQQNEKSKVIRKKHRVGCNPEKIHTPMTRQPDFDDFWKRSLAELQQVPPAFKSIERPDMSSDEIEVFEISMRSHAQIRVRGWLEVPRNTTGPLPAIIRVPGYGQNMKPTGKAKDMIVFSFNPRGHGNSQDDIPGEPSNFWIRGLDSPQAFYYRGSYLDCVRAVDYIASRTDVDQSRIAVWGGSQGGGFAFATAALDDRIDQCIADIPFLCDWINYFQLTHWPEMERWIADQPQRSWKSTLRTLSYFDTMNLADRIRCPTIMSIGLQDNVCPPTTCFNTFNRIPGKKIYRIYADKGHGLGEEHHAWVWKQLREAFHVPE